MASASNANSRSRKHPKRSEGDSSHIAEDFFEFNPKLDIKSENDMDNTPSDAVGPTTSKVRDER